MSQKNITEYIGPDSGFKYAMCFHYIPSMEGQLAKMISDRFELEHWWKIEMSEHGNWHIQACGRTATLVDDNFRKKFQAGGLYSKCLKRRSEYNDETEKSLKNPYSMALCRKPWHNNVMYVLKPFKIENERYMRWQEFVGNTSEANWSEKCEQADQFHDECLKNHEIAVAVKKSKLVSFETRIRTWYESLTVPPVTECDIISRLYDDKVVPCGAYSARSYVRAASFLMNRYVNNSSYREIFLERCYNLIDNN